MGCEIKVVCDDETTGLRRIVASKPCACKDRAQPDPPDHSMPEEGEVVVRIDECSLRIGGVGEGTRDTVQLLDSRT